MRQFIDIVSLMEGISQIIDDAVRHVRDAAAPDFAGACEGAVGDLSDLLEEHGIEHQVIEGRYLKEMDWGDGTTHPFTPHWWIEVGNYILDPTREQFGSQHLIVRKSDHDAQMYAHGGVGVVESLLHEARHYSIPIKANYISGTRMIEVPVWENPSQRDMIAACMRHPVMAGDSTLRGFSYEGKTFVWPAEEATHTAIQRALGYEGEDDDYAFYNLPQVLNFHIRGYGWQEGDPDRDRNQLIVQRGDETEVGRLLKRWKCSLGEDGYY